MLCFVFEMAFTTYIASVFRMPVASSSAQFLGNLNNLLDTVVFVLFLAIMGWVGSIFLLRGLDFLKYERETTMREESLEMINKEANPESSTKTTQDETFSPEEMMIVERLRARKNRISGRSNQG